MTACTLTMNCPAGEYANASPSNNTDCRPCPTGEWSNGGDIYSCTVVVCAVGFASSNTSTGNTAVNCAICAAGTFSAGGSVFSCSDKTCPAGSVSVSTGDAHATYNCQLCDVGTYSLGLNATTCTNSVCPTGFPSKAGAGSVDDGCITACPLGKVKSANALGTLVCQSCPTDMISGDNCVEAVDPSWKILNSALPFQTYGSTVSLMGGV